MFFPQKFHTVVKYSENYYIAPVSDVSFKNWIVTSERPESFSAALHLAGMLRHFIRPSSVNFLILGDNPGQLSLGPGKDAASLEKEFESEGISSEIIYKSGHINISLSGLIADTGSELIICGAERVNGFRRFWKGSDTYRMIRQIKRAVISVQDEYKKSSIDRIVVPIDSSAETTDKVNFAIEMSRLLHASVNIAGLNSGKSDIKSSLKNNLSICENKLKEAGIPFEIAQLTGSNLTDITLQFCDDVSADMVMMMAVEEANPKGMFEGSFPEQMILKAHIPVFATRPLREII